MPASNIHAVTLEPDVDGKVTIIGEVTKKPGCHVTLLHVWLAQPGGPGQAAAGLAIDFLAGKTTPFAGGTFTISAAAPPPRAPGTGVVGKFVEGPATVSAIAVLSDAKSGVVSEVLQWSLIMMLSKESVAVGTSAPGQGESRRSAR